MPKLVLKPPPNPSIFCPLFTLYGNNLSPAKTTPHRLRFQAMGCPCEIQLFTDIPETALQIGNSAISEIQRLEAKYSRYRSDSFLSQINQAAATGSKLKVDEETASLLDYAQTCHEQSDGLFDVTSGILRRIWRFEAHQLPDSQQIKKTLKRIGWHKLRWRAPLLSFSIVGMELDFGGIVKEYAADRIAALCRQRGATAGFVNLGGDIALIGPRPDGLDWRIGIQHPRHEANVLATVSLKTGAVASSGDYQRFMLVNGERFSHVFNPLTGWPVRHLAAVSVISQFCVVAGSAATIAMLKEEQGPAWLTALNLPHVWVDHEGRQGGNLASNE